MKFNWDGDETINATTGYVAALENLIREMLKMMREHEPHNAELWTWGEAEVRDLATSNGISFRFGGDEDKPADMSGDARVKAI